MKASRAILKQDALILKEGAPLSSAEQRDLERIESVIAAKLAAFFEVGFALIEIQQRKLYRGEFRTFEEYCRRRWDFNRSYAYRLIGAAEVCKSLSPIGDIPLPENECQIRPLAGLPTDTATKAWRKACEQAGANGKVTGALVQKAVNQVTHKATTGEMRHFRASWQLSVAPLLEEALQLTCKGDQEAVAEIINRVSLLLLIGRRTGEIDD